MKTYLIQHGKCLSKAEDPERPLSAQGIAEIEQMTDFLNGIGVSVDRLYHSGKLRAAQTAEIILSKETGPAKIEQRKGLAPLDDVVDVANEIRAMRDRIMVVGHLPHLSRLVSILITGKASQEIVCFQHGAILCLVCNEGDNQWRIGWMTFPEITASTNPVK
jgi:phosphohistidine phosphatase